MIRYHLGGCNLADDTRPRRMRHLGVVAVTVTLMFTAGTKARAVDSTVFSVTVTVDNSKPGPPIDQNIFGQFSEHLGRGIYDGIWVGEGSSIPNIHGYRKDVVDALRKIHVPVLRWPGGCFADQYDWRDGIGPRDQRPVRINENWGSVLENNAFGTHEFLDFAELIGAEPYISINMGSMTPLDAAHWVEYMTSDAQSSLAEERRRNGRDKPWKVRFVGVGNEVWGCGGEMRAEYAIDLTRRYALFVTAPEGAALVKVASGPSANLPDYREFTDALMQRAKDSFGNFVFQALSLHYYAWPIGETDLAVVPVPPLTRAAALSEDKWANYLRSARAIESAIQTVSEVMDRYDPDKKIALFVDEWGAWHEPESGEKAIFQYQQSTLLDAEVAALTLNVVQRNTERVKMANIAQMVNVVQALILTDKEKMLKTPTYHVFDMYQPFKGAIPYPAKVSGAQYERGGHSLPAVDVSAAKGEDGKTYLALVNLDPNRAADLTTNLKGRASGQILSGPAMDTHNTFEAPNTMHPVPFAGSSRSGRVTFLLPPKSVAVVAIN